MGALKSKFGFSWNQQYVPAPEVHMKSLTGLVCVSVLCLGCGGGRESKKGDAAQPAQPAQKHPPFKGVTLTEANFDEEVLRSAQPVLVEFWRDG